MTGEKTKAQRVQGRVQNCTDTQRQCWGTWLFKILQLLHFITLGAQRQIFSSLTICCWIPSMCRSPGRAPKKHWEVTLGLKAGKEQREEQLFGGSMCTRTSSCQGKTYQCLQSQPAWAGQLQKRLLYCLLKLKFNKFYSTRVENIHKFNESPN